MSMTLGWRWLLLAETLHSAVALEGVAGGAEQTAESSLTSRERVPRLLIARVRQA